MAEYLLLDQTIRKHFIPIMERQSLSLLSANENFFAVGAIEEDAACGYLVAERNDMGYVLHDIFVHPDFRRRGIGTGLLQVLIKMASVYVEDIDCTYLLPEDASFRLFLESTGVFVFEEEEESRIYRGDVELLYHSKFLSPLMALDLSKADCVDFYEELPAGIRNQFIHECLENEYLPVYSIPTQRESDTKFCYAVLSKDNTKVCAFLMIKAEADTAYIESVWAKKGNEKKFMILLASVAKKLHEDASIMYLETCVAKTEVEELLNRLIPGMEIVARGESAYWNYEDMEVIAK